MTRTLAALSCAALLCAAPAGAQSLTITPTNVSVSSDGTAPFTVIQGDTFTFTADLTVSGGTLFLNSDNPAFISPTPGPTEVGPPTSSSTVALDDSPFFNNPPGSVTDATLTNVALFTLTVGSDATVGTYSGSFTIQGGPNGMNDMSDLATQNFTVNVAPAPEPSSVAVLGLGAFGLLGLVHARRRRRD